MSRSESHTAESQEGVSQVFEALETKVPLALLVDLHEPQGPDSEQILRDENPCDTSWISRRSQAQNK